MWTSTTQSETCFVVNQDLFSSVPVEQLPGTPLAERLRPRTLDQVVGQTKVMGQIRGFLASGNLPSMIFWGPPGTGKTTLALAVAHQIQAEFISVNAVDTGAKNLKEIGDQSRDRRIHFQRQTILFIDEIHRLNKAQQDVLLSYVERGDLVVIGATTENPSYEINRALLSRSRLMVFERLSLAELAELAQRAFPRVGFEDISQILNSQAREALFAWCDGDGRRLLNSLSQVFAHLQAKPEASPLSLEQLFQIIGERPLGYDKQGDMHYDLISAFIKSIRGSDANAALYYLARMLKGGEDPKFICRRLIVLASEDVGNADPRGLMMATAGMQAVEAVGLPEGAINMAQVTCYLASAPKSNRSYEGLQKAQAYVEQTGNLPVPLPLRSAQTESMKNLGYGRGYQYPHSHVKAYVEQSYWPQGGVSQDFYIPSDVGFEKQIKDFQKWLKGSN